MIPLRVNYREIERNVMQKSGCNRISSCSVRILS